MKMFKEREREREAGIKRFSISPGSKSPGDTSTSSTCNTMSEQPKKKCEKEKRVLLVFLYSGIGQNDLAGRSEVAAAGHTFSLSLYPVKSSDYS